MRRRSGFFRRNPSQYLVQVERLITLVKADDEGEGEGRHADRDNDAGQDKAGGDWVGVDTRVLHAVDDDRRGAAGDITFRGKKQIDPDVGYTQPHYLFDEITVEKQGREAYTEEKNRNNLVVIRKEIFTHPLNQTPLC